MNKASLASHLVKQTGMTKTMASRALAALFDPASGAIPKAIKKGEKVTIAGFGSFQKAHRKARYGSNRQSGESMKIPASKTIRFKIGAPMRDQINRAK